MDRFRVNARFGPWDVGDEFESDDDLHYNLAHEGILSKIADAGSVLVEEPEEVGTPPPADPEPQVRPSFLQSFRNADTAPPEQLVQEQNDD